MTKNYDKDAPWYKINKINVRFIVLFHFINVHTTLTFIPQQACSIFEPFQLPGEHATLAAITALLG